MKNAESGGNPSPADYAALQERVDALTNQLSTMALRLDSKHGNSLSSPVRSPTIAFPTFNGDDVDSWVFKCDQFFTVTDISELNKVTYASVHLESRALAWHQTYTKNRTSVIPLGWEEYKLAVKARFGDPYEDPMSEMLALKQTNTVKAYHDAFDLILSKLNLPPVYALSCFISGLEEKIASMVRLLKPKSVQEAYGLAKLQESTLQINPKTTKSYPTFSPSSKPPLLTNPHKNFQNKFQNNQKPHPINTNTPPPSRFKPANAEIEAKIAKGQCFYCDEKYTPQHVCKNKKRTLYSLELEEEQEVEMPEEGKANIPHEEGGEITQISVYALAGKAHCQTMRVHGQIGKKILSILIDSGSSHNFIDMGFAAKLGMFLTPIDTFNISVANGGRLTCSHQIAKLNWRIRDINFIADFYAIPLGGCDAVLGVQWLETLGPITWDFKNLTMEFVHGGRRIVLKGITKATLKEPSLKYMIKAVEEGGQLAVVQPSHWEVEFFALHLAIPEVESPELQSLLKKYPDVFL